MDSEKSDYAKIRDHVLAEKKKDEAEQKERARQERISLGYPAEEEEEKKPNYDSPYTMNNGTAIVLYIVVMIVGTIFNDRWVIWVSATIILIAFLNRHNKKKKK